MQLYNVKLVILQSFRRQSR